MSENWLEGRTALVTGAGKRIGHDLAVALADEGANIVVHYRSSADEAEKLQGELRKSGVKSWLVNADFEKPEEYETLIDRARRIAGSLDVLINSAAIFPPSTLDDVQFRDVVQSLQVNAWAPFVLSRSFARIAKCGKIINMLDSRVTSYDWGHVAYILSKHALTTLTEMLALRYAPDITVNGIAPGLILPPPGRDDSYVEHLAKTVPLKRRGDPDDIAEAVIYLLKSDFVTGQVIYVDGGRHLREYNRGSYPD
ncbi:MAG: SDR family oxidoreductase [Armatimonadota bacterium]|jgi:hypothetical protein